MSYILCDHDNYYSPGERLQTLFEELVVQPFENHSPTSAWKRHVTNTDHKYHREKILEQGRTNFDEPFNGLEPEDKVLLYCIYYMPAHLYSSYHVFTKHLDQVSDKVVFIDFGCGPLTSGIAFWAACAEHCDITYLGIDSSQKMRDKALEINKYGRFFTKCELRADWNGLSEVLDQYIVDGDQTQIIFNFSYFLASKTLDIGDLCDCLTQIVEKYSRHKMCMVYQNPVESPDSHRNWATVKSELSAFRSQTPQSKIENFSCYWLRLQNGGLIWRKTRRPIEVYFDVLSNQSSDYSKQSVSRGDSMAQLTLGAVLDSVPDSQPSEAKPSPKNEHALKAIPGLQYIEDYINQEQHDWALDWIDKEEWLDDLKRRVQHYGFKYDYRARKVNWDMRIGELPEWLKRLSRKLYNDGHMPEVADQVIVNEYKKGQGISNHIDCEPCFEDTIVSLSLGSGCIMDFINKDDKTEKIHVWLAPRSLVVLSGEARYNWLHGIPARKSDVWEGQKYLRERRVSLTFRKVILENEEVSQR